MNAYSRKAIEVMTKASELMTTEGATDTETVQLSQTMYPVANVFALLAIAEEIGEVKKELVLLNRAVKKGAKS